MKKTYLSVILILISFASNAIGPINGSSTICAGTTTYLSISTSGGTWSSSNTAIATIGSTTGIAMGVTAGTAIISYIAGVGVATTVMTINPNPGPITGITHVCDGGTFTTHLSDSSPGGTWSSSDGTVASIGSTSGIVTGILAGSATITYALTTTGCFITSSLVTNPPPYPISGSVLGCTGSTTALTDVEVGGTWSSSNTAIATIGSLTGIVTGHLTGTTNITYAMATGCMATAVVTVNTTPAAISGTTSVCEGLTTTLSTTPTGGIWTMLLLIVQV